MIYRMRSEILAQQQSLESSSVKVTQSSMRSISKSTRALQSSVTSLFRMPYELIASIFSYMIGNIITRKVIVRLTDFRDYEMWNQVLKIFSTPSTSLLSISIYE